jgi:subtilisin-like proprotein convertase family protein
MNKRILSLRILTVIAIVLGSASASAAPGQPLALAAPAAPYAPVGTVPGAPPGCAATTTSFPKVTNKTITFAGSPVTDTVTVAGMPAFIWDVNITTVITHTFSSDLNIYLVSPAGTEVTLTSGNAGGHADVYAGTTWDDQAAVAVTMYPFQNGVAPPALMPEEAMGAFIGENPNGVWTLRVVDTFPDENGHFVSWSLEITSLASAPAVIEREFSYLAASTIPNPGTITRTLSADVPSGDLPVGGLILSTTVQHARAADLQIRLISPPGLMTTVAHNVINAGADLYRGTRWHDKAGSILPPGPITDNAFPPPGVAITHSVPQGAMAALNGFSGRGIWSLVVQDSLSNAYGGSLLSWALAVRLFSCAPVVEVSRRTENMPWWPIAGQPYTYQVYAVNHGSTASSLTLSHPLPPGTTLLNLEAPGGTCSQPPIGQHGSIACTYSSVGQNATPSYTVTIQTPLVPQLLRSTIFAASSPPSVPGSVEEDEFYEITFIRSANRNPWDVADALASDCPSPCDSGGIEDGGQDAFDDYGKLRLVVQDGSGSTVVGGTGDLIGFGLAFSLDRKWHTATPVNVGGVAVSRALHAPAQADYLRYVDTFANTSGQARRVWVAWGGNLGSDFGTNVARSSSGDTLLSTGDTWAVTIQSAGFNPNGPAEDPPVGYGLRGLGDTTYQGPAIFGANPITTTWPMTANDHLAHVFRLDLAPGESASLAYFLYRGLSETNNGPEDCDYLPDPCTIPPAPSEINKAAVVMAALAAEPDFCDLSQAERANIRNWPGADDMPCLSKLYLPLVRR